MDKQIKNIELLEDGRLRLKTGRLVKPHNKIVEIFTDSTGTKCIRILTNHIKGTDQYKYRPVMNLEDYINHSCWEHNIWMNSSHPESGSIVMDTGWTHVALTGLFAGYTNKKRAMMYNFDRTDIRRANVYFVTRED